MKIFNHTRIAIIAVFLASLWVKGEEVSFRRPKIGLVLSGGGAKGFAHIGVLSLLDSLEIPVDYIVGTSMGGILGSLYAIGYRGYELQEMAYETDWVDLFSDQPVRETLPYIEKRETGRYNLEIGILGTKPTIPSGMISGQKLSLLFSSKTFHYEQFRDFNELPIPIRCIAADLVTGNEVVLSSGSLAKAMRATMSIPTVFSPVEWGDSLLIDGGVVNNLPVDIAKQMGADIVIAVDVMGHSVPRDQLNNAFNILERATHLMSIERWRNNIALADLVITPNLNTFTLGDFTHAKIKSIIREGKRVAGKEKNNLIELKALYHLQRSSNPNTLPMMEKTPILEDIQIIGPATTPFEIIYNQLQLRTNSEFNYRDFDARIRQLTENATFHDIQYEVIPLSDRSIRLLIRVEETQKPIIYRITIEGNKNLPFGFIYNLLRLIPGDFLDIENLNQRIMNLYGLGYFEHIDYEIFSVYDQMMHLNIIVKEFPMRELRVGVRYNDEQKLVIAAGLQINSMIFPGLRFENELQFAGLVRFWNKLYYPSRSLNTPVYPLLRQSYKNIPTNIFDGYGNQEAQYQNRSNVLGAGLGWNPINDLNIEIETLTEKVLCSPSIAMTNSDYFQRWHERLNMLHMIFHLDTWNDALIPTEGIYALIDYEASLEKWKTDTPFHRLQCTMDSYIPIFSRTSLRIYGFYGYGTSNMPVYKYHNQGYPDYFIGMKYHQLVGRVMTLYRCEFQIHLGKRIYGSLCANQVVNLKNNLLSHHIQVWGAGAGIKMLIPLGLVSLNYGLGSRGLMVSKESQSVFYFSLGMKF